MTYSPPAYWIERGRGYEAEAIERGWHDTTVEPLFALMRTLHFHSVLEVGCGFGRIAAGIAAEWPAVRYSGMDVSPDMLTSAMARVPGAEFYLGDLASWQTMRRWDLVISVSVLGHLLPSDIESVVARLLDWSCRDLVVIEWDAPGQSTPYQFGHDYRALLPGAVETPMGAQTMFHLARP